MTARKVIGYRSAEAFYWPAEEMRISEKTFDEVIMELRARPRRRFAPIVHGDRYGTIEAYWKDNACYAETITPNLTLYRDQETKEVVGVAIYGATKLLGLVPAPSLLCRFCKGHGVIGDEKEDGSKEACFNCNRGIPIKPGEVS